MGDTEELQRALAALLDAGPVEVHENGQWLALPGLGFEVRSQGSSTIIHLWSSCPGCAPGQLDDHSFVVCGTHPGAPHFACRGEVGGPRSPRGPALRTHETRHAGI